MATPIKRIEKEFLIKSLYDEQIPVIFVKGQTQYILKVDKPTKGQMFFKPDLPVEGLKVRKKMDLMFDYRGQVIIFSVEITSIKDEYIITDEPEFLYKNLERSFTRVSSPPDLDVQLTFLGDRYSLTYPKLTEFEASNLGTMTKAFDLKNFGDLVEQLALWIKQCSSAYKLVIFKDVKPSSTEERLLAETGKAFYLPLTEGALPVEDPYPKKCLITEDLFKRYLESTGVDLHYVDDAYRRFIKQKFDSGISSDLWVPILFQEYVIGYIHMWNTRETQRPLGTDIVDQLYQFAKILANALKINGYFDSGKMKNDPFEGRVVDISASGILFSYPNSVLSATLLTDNELSVQLTAPRRVVSAKARIVRRYKDTVQTYYGCRFMDMVPEDLRFIFEYIYGKPFTDLDAAFLTGQV